MGFLRVSAVCLEGKILRIEWLALGVCGGI